MKFSMSPIINIDSKLLILGSLSGEKSLHMQEYYAHPQNQFWKIICHILHEEIPKTYSQKKQLLLQNNIALWDVIDCAERANSSLDSEIKNPIVNDIEKLLKTHKNIKRILLNGGKASSLFKKNFKSLDIECIPLPSTSPAYASMTVEEKINIWEKAIKFI